MLLLLLRSLITPGMPTILRAFERAQNRLVRLATLRKDQATATWVHVGDLRDAMGNAEIRAAELEAEAERALRVFRNIANLTN